MDSRENNRPNNPRDSSNIFSKLFFWWMLPLFRKGSREELTLDDLYSAPKEKQARQLGLQLSKVWEAECRKSEKLNRPPKFYKAIAKIHLRQFLLSCCGLMLDEWVLRVAQVICLQRLIISFTLEEPSKMEQYLYGTGIILTAFVHSVLIHTSMFGLTDIGMKARIASSSLIYQKSLRFTKWTQSQAPVGRVTNLLANDVTRFDYNFVDLPYIFIGPIQLFIFIYLLWTMADIGWSTLAGTGFIALLMPIQYFVSTSLTKFRFEISRQTDARSQMMNEILNAMRIVKMYAWEEPFSNVVNQLRRVEVKALRKAAYLRAVNLSLFYSSSNLVPALSIIAFVLLEGGELKAESVFFVIAVYNNLRVVSIYFIPIAATQISELVVATNRIESFLLLNENDSPPQSPQVDENEIPTKKSEVPSSIVMKNVSASWTEVKSTIEDFNINLNGDKIVMIIGPVGSGKSSFLHTLLQELPTQGQCVVKGQISYASQEPWIFGGNIRQNILFGRDYDPIRYEQVLNASALLQDLEQLPYADKTNVGDRGVALSGGQKARLNLARTLYQRSDIYLLDDPLSAVDPHVSRHIFENCLVDFLKGRLRILVTHQLQYLQQADHIIVLNQGKILGQGRYDELIKLGIDFVNLLTPQNQTKESDKKFEEVTKEAPKTDMELPQPETEVEKVVGGSVGSKIYWKYLRAGGSLFGLILLTIGFIISQVFCSGADYWLSYWTKEIASSREKCEQNLTFEMPANLNFKLILNQVDEDDPCGNKFENDNYLYIYCGLIILTFLTMKGRAVYFFHYCLNISINIHNKMLTSLTRAPIKFFDDNPSGRILNRFSKDLCSMDEPLLPAFFDTLSIFLMMLITLIVIIISNYFIVIHSVVLIILLILIRRFYVSTALLVKRIESTARSPLYTHLVSSIHGLTTIRACGRENILIDQFDQLQDSHSSAAYIVMSANRAFGLWLEIICSLFITTVTYTFLVLSGSFESSQVGLAITSALNLTGAFQFGMRQSTETENYMISVARAFEYVKLTPEAELESKINKKPPMGWPQFGQIQFKKVYLAYDSKDILKDLTFDVKGQEKIGIVGRTGAGKSSIIAALFRMTEPRGQILIDGIEINEIGLHDLRKNISIIPQDPVLFSGSLRYNLDPFSQFPDDRIWEVLEQVQLKESVTSLDFGVNDSGNNFSIGQRQLVCLARAILRRNKIIVMDEATAHVDHETDSFIQKTIRHKFSDCTVITIAHRLQSVMDCDRILVLDNGHLKEYDDPQILLQNPNGIFTSMVNSGQGESNK